MLIERWEGVVIYALSIPCAWPLDRCSIHDILMRPIEACNSVGRFKAMGAPDRRVKGIDHVLLSAISTLRKSLAEGKIIFTTKGTMIILIEHKRKWPEPGTAHCS